MQELNAILEQYVDVPKAQSLPNMKYISTPTGCMTPENQEEFELMIAELYKGQRYEFDTNEYEQQRQSLEEFLFYRKKFEQSQKNVTHADK